MTTGGAEHGREDQGIVGGRMAKAGIAYLGLGR